MKNQRKGFTLYELLAVLALLALIFTIVKPRVTGYFEKSRQAVLVANVKLIEDTVRLKLNDYPKDKLFANSTTPFKYDEVWTEDQINDYMASAFSRYLEIYLEDGDWHENSDGFKNPYSGKNGIVNYNTYTILNIRVQDEQTGESFPINQPAVFITNDALCSYTGFAIPEEEAVLYLQGTIVIYINEATGNVDIYYVTKEGVPSATHVQARY